MITVTEWPQHKNSHLANTTHLWYGTDSEESFASHCSDPITYKQLADLGYLDTKITYTYNEQGFRSIKFDKTISAGLALGCSFTQGVGLSEEQVWPSIVSKQLNCPVWNLGVGSNSMDTVFRLADYWVPILNPKFVLVACPAANRIEFYNSNGEFINVLPGDSSNHLNYYKEWILTPINARLNFKKNLLAITTICNQHNIPLVALSIDNDFSFDKQARDLAHSGPVAQTKFANKMIKGLNNIL